MIFKGDRDQQVQVRGGSLLYGKVGICGFKQSSIYIFPTVLSLSFSLVYLIFFYEATHISFFVVLWALLSHSVLVSHIPFLSPD
jgi:hypothetical protein